MDRFKCVCAVCSSSYQYQSIMDYGWDSNQDNTLSLSFENFPFFHHALTPPHEILNYFNFSFRVAYLISPRCSTLLRPGIHMSCASLRLDEKALFSLWR